MEVWSDPDVLKKCKIPVADTVKEYDNIAYNGLFFMPSECLQLSVVTSFQNHLKFRKETRWYPNYFSFLQSPTLKYAFERQVNTAILLYFSPLI